MTKSRELLESADWGHHFTALLIVTSAICFIAFGVSYSELRRVRLRLAEVSHHSFHDHVAVREFMIRAQLSQVKNPIVIYGDSITEMARLPRELCARPVINAGIGGIDSAQAAYVLPKLFRKPPFLLALAFGANDVGNSKISQHYSRLIGTARRLTPRVVAISDTADSNTENAIRRSATGAGISFVETVIPVSLKLRDGIHFTNAAYRIWLPALSAEITKECEADALVR